VSIPDSVTSIGSYAFYRCFSLSSINVGAANAVYANNASDGVLYDKAIATLIQYPVGNTRTSFTIPNSVTSIREYAFFYCDALTFVTISDKVTSIGYAAFLSCTSLTSIIIPDSVTSIGGYAFYSCTSLTSIIIPDSVTSIGNYTFYDCTSLSSVTLGSGTTSIGQKVFYHCYSLTSVIIPSNLASIKSFAFADCISLTSITFLGRVSPTTVGANWLNGTPMKIRGHAYVASNFPVPGKDFHGLIMGDAIPPPSAPQPT
jgi:hypothetical protein